MRWSVLCVVLCACSRKPTPDITKDPSPVDAALPDTAPRLPPKERAIIHGRIIDLDLRGVAFELRKSSAPFEAIDDKRAYLVDTDVVAHDNKTGVELFRAKPTACAKPSLGRTHLYCADGLKVTAIATSDGTMRTIASAAPSPVEQMVEVGDRLIVRRADRTLESFEIATGLLRTATTISTIDPWIGLKVIAGDLGVCGVGPDGAGHVLTCFRPDLGLRLKKTIDLHKPTDPKSTWFHARSLDDKHLVIGTHWSPTVHRAAVFRVVDGVELVRVEDEIVAVVEREQGELDGFVALVGDLHYLLPSGKVAWTFKGRVSDSASALVRKGRLFVASFHRSASGAALDAFDVGSGKHLWSGEVEQLPIAHSIYLNDVMLTYRADALVMRGEEAALSYLQMFDPDNGKRLFSDNRMRSP